MPEEIYVSTAAFKRLRSLPEALKMLAESEIPCVELSGGHCYYEGDLVDLLRQWGRTAKFNYVTHNYFPVPRRDFLLNIASVDEKEWERSIEFCTRSLEIAADIGSPVYGIHAGYAGRLRDRGDGYFFPDADPTERTWRSELDTAYHQLLRAVNVLSPISHRLGVKLCVENLFPMPGLPPQLMTGLAEWQRFFDDSRGSGVGLLLDLAHLRIAERLAGEDMGAAIEWLLGAGRDHVYQIHLSDTDGNWDHHAPIEADSWLLKLLDDWARVVGWPIVPVSYESRDLSIDHLNAVMPLIKAAYYGRA